MGSEGKYDLLKKILMPVGITVGIIILIALFFYIFAIPLEIYVIYKVFSYVASKIVDISGINQWLVKGIVIIALIPLIWVIPRIYRGKHKKIARAIGLLYVAVFFLTLYFVSKDVKFTHSTGEALKWYVITPQGIKYFDSEGFDPDTGKKAQKVTPEVMAKLKAWEKGTRDFNLVDPSKADWFNPLTGEPQIWYYQYPDGTFEFYNKLAHHPVTGDLLEPVNKQIYFEWHEKFKSMVTPETLKKPKESQVAVVKPGEIDEKERRQNDFKTLINREITAHPSLPNVALIIESKKTETGISPEDILYNLLRTEKVNVIINIFREGLFKSKGFFKDIYDGSTELLTQSDALSRIDCLILGRLNYSFTKREEIDRNLISCNINFSYKVIGKKGNMIRSDSISVTGPGFSKDAALERSLEMLAEKYSDRIIKPVL